MSSRTDNVGPLPPVEKEPKVFGIGFHKTGTTSLGQALERMGYRVCHGAGPVRAALGHHTMMSLLRQERFEPVLRVAEEYDAFQDNPWYLLFRELDRRFPGSRFILTLRDEGRWIESAVRHFGTTESDLRRWIYGPGAPVGNEDTYLERYRRHNRAVLEHFAERPGDLLTVSWEEGDGWSELCRFLGRPEPAGHFPHANRRSPRSPFRRWLRRLLG